MIHILGWLAVVLTAGHSYLNRRHLDPHGALEHRAALPAVAFGCAMVFVLAALVTSTGVA